MRIRRLHHWRVTPASAIRLQTQLAEKVIIRPTKRPIRLIAGMDCAYSHDQRLIYAAVVVLDAQTLDPVDKAIAIKPLSFPYIPGLLSFREGPAMLKACDRLRSCPDLVFVDGQGIAHPRRLGVASHIGLLLARSTIGCAKRRLSGQYIEPGRSRGSFSELIDPATGQVIGAVVRTRTGIRPVFVSPGHLCDIELAIYWTIRSARSYRIPEPLRLAHQLAGSLKASEL